MDGITGQIGITVCKQPRILAVRHIAAPRDIECGVAAAAGSLQLYLVAVILKTLYHNSAIGSSYAACHHLDLITLIIHPPYGVFAVRYGIAGTGIDSRSVQCAVVLYELKELYSVTLYILVCYAVTTAEIWSGRSKHIVTALHHRRYIDHGMVLQVVTRIIHAHTPLSHNIALVYLRQE